MFVVLVRAVLAYRVNTDLAKALNVGTVSLFIALFVALDCVIPSSALAADEPRRLAFVVGIDTYDNLGDQKQLTRAVRDADDVAATLTGLGFTVVSGVGVNLERDAFTKKWKDFVDQINPRRNDTVAIFMSGHGVEIEGESYFLTKNAPFVRAERQNELKREGISLKEMMLDLKTRKSRIVLMMVDACRTNPFIPKEFAATGLGGGSFVDDGMLLIYSASSDQTALDRLPMNPSDPNPNSVFTRALLPLLEGLKTSPTPLYLAWYQTLRNNVRGIAEKAQSNQSPKAYSGLEGEFCLLDNCAQPFSPLPQLDGEAHGYDIIQSATEQALLDYVSRYRGSASAKLAERRLAELTRKRSVLYVISVGIDEYPAPLANLRYSAKDASEILRAIQTRSGPFYQTIRGYLLTNRTATRSSILEAFDAARYSAKSTDTLIVYLSGHVATIDNEAYLVPANADLNGVRSLVSLTELQRTLALTFGRVILFVDTCGVRFTPPINTILLDRNRDAQLTVLSASEPDGLAFESDDLGHSVFAYALLKGLSGSAARFVPTAPPFSFITINDLAEFISANVRELTKGEQRPYFITSDGDFALVPFSRPQ